MKQFWNRYIEEMEAILKANGAAVLQDFIIYRSVRHFMIASGVCGLLGCMAGVKFHWSAGVVGFIAGIFIPIFILWMSNERDNVIILNDLKWLYETITVQLQAGLHIQQALQESEGLMRNKRLRLGLQNLTEQLLEGGNLNLALDNFEHSFNNRYINSFCLILRQMQDSGYAVKLLEDIRLQMEEMERVQLGKKKEALEMQLQVFQMLLFLGILVLLIYGCIMAAFQNINYL
jgi:Flp pilus assembly protein TadB